jgi:hypothetical protein
MGWVGLKNFGLGWVWFENKLLTSNSACILSSVMNWEG